jgi:penicillin-binding protein 1A
MSAFAWKRIALWGAATLAVGMVAGAGALGIAVAVIRPQLADVSALANYQPKLPLRVYTAEGVLIGEFGEERRELVRIEQIPQVMKDAVIAVEDARFYQHGGIDGIGLLRAIVANVLRGELHQGASTLTQQVARNVYLSSERTLSRKLSEALLAQRLEAKLSKDQILEIYLNQIYLGQRAYGFAAAAQAYYGKPLAQLSIAEAAMLAGLPKAPHSNNPVVNPRRAHAPKQYVFDRMLLGGFITDVQATLA